MARVFLIILGILFSNSAGASYDRECLAAILGNESSDRTILEFRASWLISLYKTHGRTRGLTDLEIDAMIDLVHDLPFYGRFADYSERLFVGDSDSFTAYRHLLTKTTLVNVTYSPKALATVGGVLKTACRILGRENCEAYDAYEGLRQAGRRPLTPRQELLVKWAGIAMLPTKDRIAHFQRMDAQDLRQLIDESQRAAEDQASALIEAAFPDRNGDASRLLQRYILPVISAGYSHFLEKMSGRKPN